MAPPVGLVSGAAAAAARDVGLAKLRADLLERRDDSAYERLDQRVGGLRGLIYGYRRDAAGTWGPSAALAGIGSGGQRDRRGGQALPSVRTVLRMPDQRVAPTISPQMCGYDVAGWWCGGWGGGVQSSICGHRLQAAIVINPGDTQSNKCCLDPTLGGINPVCTRSVQSIGVSGELSAVMPLPSGRWGVGRPPTCGARIYLAKKPVIF